MPTLGGYLDKTQEVAGLQVHIIYIPYNTGMAPVIQTRRELAQNIVMTMLSNNSSFLGAKTR